MYPTLYRPLFHNATLRHIVCTAEALVVIQFWLADLRLADDIWHLNPDPGLALRTHLGAHTVQSTWFLIGSLVAAVFGLLLMLRLLVPATEKPATEANAEQLRATIIGSTQMREL
jgi:hypothetical protein